MYVYIKGVPLLSLPGDRMQARAGASMAMALEEPAWLVRSLGDYIALARRYVLAFADKAPRLCMYI